MARLCLPVMGLLLSLLWTQYVSAAKYVFAEHNLRYAKSHTKSTWAIDLNQGYGIDAFALAITYPYDDVADQLDLAFAAFDELEDPLSPHFFFSFDYVNGEVWPTDAIVTLLKKYTTRAGYFWFRESPDDFPFISTCGGFANAPDWDAQGDIRSNFGPIYFVPDYSGAPWPELVGAGENSNKNGLFLRELWGIGATNKTDAVDRAFVKEVIEPDGLTYMMGVSPWFFHSAHPGKNWVWRGDDLWHTRWLQTTDPQINAKFVMIVSWNDYGSSHYIGPIHYKSEVPAASVAYLQSHDGWPVTLNYYINHFKKTPGYTIQSEFVQYWYIRQPTSGGSPCGVVGNNADLGQTELPASEVVEDAIFVTAQLLYNTTINVSIGNHPAVSYAGVVGVNHWSQPFNGQTGVPNITMTRGSELLGYASGMKEITPRTTLATGCVNYNPFTGLFTPIFSFK